MEATAASVATEWLDTAPNVVGVGASAGGLEALVQFFRNAPPDNDIAYVVVTHQHPDHVSLLPDLLGKETTMPVKEIRDGDRVQRNTVHLAVGGTNLAMLGPVFHLMPARSPRNVHLPIDYFFRSLAENLQQKAVGVVLSGTGSDGTLGVKEIKGASGMVMVEDPVSAQYSGMPQSAIATGLVDYILPPDKMPEQLIKYVHGPYLTRRGPEEIDESKVRPALQKIFIVLRNRTGHDFSSYKLSTIRRRIERRMNVHQIAGTNDYVRFLEENPSEIDLLFKELLIGVTGFFRDAEAFNVLAKEALPELVATRRESRTFRVWIPGCSTGEEAYSIAILLRECAEAQGALLDFQIFATDLDSNAIEVARHGVYPDGIAVDVSPERLARYFSREDTNWCVNKSIREMLVFAEHNLIKDPPFIKLDLLCCRNLLIYLDSDLQKRLLPMFHYAMKPGGVLFLGSSETVGDSHVLFETLSKKWKVFRRREADGSAALMIPGTFYHHLGRVPESRFHAESTQEQPAERGEHRISEQIQRYMITTFVPPSVIVNDHGDILYVHGRTGLYLELETGRNRNNIFGMAREGLRIDLESAIRQVRTQKERDFVVFPHVRVKSNGEYSYANLIVRKLGEPEALRGLIMVTFEPARPLETPAAKLPKPARGEKKSSREEELHRELLLTKENLQRTIEELEVTNEELRSSNEELQSTNEELQSANEELETSKEEMQSLNEELQTVNAELQEKVEAYSQANDDMQNLLNSTDIATIFLDERLNIRRFTRQAKKVIKLIQTDVGRPIGDLASNLAYDGLEKDARKVLDSLVFQEQEVRTLDGSWYLMRIMPYRTSSNVIDGLVMTFVNINKLKQAQQESAEAQMARKLAEAVVQSIEEPLMVLDSNHCVVSVNETFLDRFGFRSEDVLNRPIGELGDGRFRLSQLDELTLPIDEKTPFREFEIQLDQGEHGKRTVAVRARQIQAGTQQPGSILVAMQDVSEKKGDDRPSKEARQGETASQEKPKPEKP